MNSEMGSKTSERLKRLRQKLGLSQRELAKVLCVTPGAVAHWERNERSLSGPVARLVELYESGVLKLRNGIVRD